MTTFKPGPAQRRPVRLQILSDLHLERGTPFVPAKSSADVIVLAGDIHEGVQGIAWARKTFPEKAIVYVAGNHEFYRQSWDRLADEMRSEAGRHEIHFLENEEVTTAGVRFLGATLWTDFEFFGAETKQAAMDEIQASAWEYRKVHGPEDGRITPQHTLARHKASRDWLKSRLADKVASPTVVVTHHYPCRHSTPARFADSVKTAAFGSHLEHLLGGPAAWVHGHTHTTCDYTQQGTRIVCNPLGGTSPGKPPENKLFDPEMVISLQPGEHLPY